MTAAATPDLRPLLAGGDRRSLAHAGEALALLRAGKAGVAQLVRLAEDDDWLVEMRVLDVLEKLARDHADWVQPHRHLFIGPLARHESWEIRLQIARALPLLGWTAPERARAIAILEDYAAADRTFVRAWAVAALARFAERDVRLAPRVARLLEELERSRSRALQARAADPRTARRGRLALTRAARPRRG